MIHELHFMCQLCDETQYAIVQRALTDDLSFAHFIACSCVLKQRGCIGEGQRLRVVRQFEMSSAGTAIGTLFANTLRTVHN